MTSTPHIDPFEIENAPLLWAWLQEFPAFNFDNTGPKSAEELAGQIRARIDDGETVCQVSVDGRPVGAIGMSAYGEIVAFRGICFAKWVHGSGLPLEAVSQVLDHAFSAGFKKAMASHFSDNLRVGAFLGKLGAVKTTLREADTKREGMEEWFWQNVEITAHDFYEKRRTRQANTDASKDLQVAS